MDVMILVVSILGCRTFKDPQVAISLATARVARAAKAMLAKMDGAERRINVAQDDLTFPLRSFEHLHNYCIIMLLLLARLPLSQSERLEVRFRACDEILLCEVMWPGHVESFLVAPLEFKDVVV